MEAFNIKIQTNNKETTLTILPEDDEYKIIYFGGIIGALKQNDGKFNFIEPEDVVPGSLPLYKYKQAESTSVELELRLTADILKQIIYAIENAISLNKMLK